MLFVWAGPAGTGDRGAVLAAPGFPFSSNCKISNQSAIDLDQTVAAPHKPTVSLCFSSAAGAAGRNSTGGRAQAWTAGLI